MQGVARQGPIPAEEYSVGAAHQSAPTGPTVMNLAPVGHNAQGRTKRQLEAAAQTKP